jgi:murein DD-endopeptidase MepM/ murein hydrolase activator NlpD
VKLLAVLAALSLGLVAGAARGADFTVVPDAALPTAAATATDFGGALAPAPVWTAMETPAAPADASSSSLLSVWQSAGQAYGIPWQVLAAINKVESNFGRNMGPSSAGAIGWMQFMPSTWQRWGVDADGNGVADPWNATDAIYSAARYLAAAGGQTDLSRAVFAYNHAQWYVDEVLQLAQAYGLGTTAAPASAAPVVFSLDRLQTGLVQAGQLLSSVNARYLPALARVKKWTKRVAHLRLRAGSALLLSRRLAAQQLLVQAAIRLDAARRRLAPLSRSLVQARTHLRDLTAEAGRSSFNRTVAGVVAAPLYDNGWVFPVGGGPDVVSVGHTHHDYPAADIAAPEGSPVYALGDAVVLRAWQAPDARCGIGATLQTTDGETWTYCHLSYLDPAVAPGARLTAGASLGLVGATGDATGPHLHLQLDPSTAYPQDESWFQAFAGTAFRWQDTGPVFSIVP